MLAKLVKFLSYTTISQAFVVLSIPMLSKFYSAESFGLLGIYTAYCSVSSALIGLRFDYALSSSENGDENSIISICFLLSFVFFFPSLIIFTLITNSLWISFLISICSSFVMLFNAIQAYYVRIDKVKKASSLFLLRTIVMISFQFSLFNYETGLFYAYVISYLFVVVVFYPYATIRHIFSVGFKEHVFIFSKYFDFIKFNLPHTALNVFSTNLPYMVIDVFYGKESVGYFTMAMRVVQVPHRFISNALRQVISYQFSESDAKTNHALFLKTTLVLLFISCVFFIPVFLYSEFIFITILGSEWQAAGMIVSILSFWFGVSLTNVPAISFLTVSRNLKLLFCLELFSFIFRILLFFTPMFYLISFSSFICVYSTIGVVFNIMVIFGAYKKSSRKS